MSLFFVFCIAYHQLSVLHSVAILQLGVSRGLFAIIIGTKPQLFDGGEQHRTCS